MEIARLKSEIEELSIDISKQSKEQISLLPELLRLSVLFKRAILNQQRSILNRVFKQGITFRDGMFRTPSLNPLFHHNCLAINKKRLLEVEESIEENFSVPFNGVNGSVLEHLSDIFNILKQIRAKE